VSASPPRRRTDADFSPSANLAFAEDTTEWTGTDIAFDIAASGDKTEVRFTHVGLTPEFECFDSCSSAWSFYIKGSLRELITAGTGQPNPTE
jgi:hypothetical protein